jgi:hypothetical protein
MYGNTLTAVIVLPYATTPEHCSSAFYSNHEKNAKPQLQFVRVTLLVQTHRVWSQVQRIGVEPRLRGATIGSEPKASRR